MKQFHNLLKNILDNGFTHGDRTGVGRRSIYNVHLDFDVSKFFPAVTTQKVFLQTAVKETLWMLAGSSRIDEPGLELPIWKQWTLSQEGIDANETLLTNLAGFDKSDISSKLGTIGNLYPQAWRSAPNNNKSIRKRRTLDELPSDLVKHYGNDFLPVLNEIYWSKYDQINEVFLNLKKRPYSSRHRVSAWIPEWIPDEEESSQYNIINNRGALTPCHSFFQFTVGDVNPETGKSTLNLYLYCGSSDCPVGLLYNVAGYTTLLYIFANLLNMSPGRFSVAIGDAHIYTNQIELVKEQLTREIYEPQTQLVIKDRGQVDPFDFLTDDFSFTNYQHHPHIKYPVAV